MYNFIKTISTYFALCLFLVLSVTLVHSTDSQASGSQKLVVMTGEWEPYVGSMLPGFGFTSDIIQEASNAAGLDVSIQFAPWPRCEASIEHGKAFATFPYSPNELRTKFAHFSQAIAKSRTVFFYNNEKLENFDFSRLEEVKPHLIGGVRGYYYEPRFTKLGLAVDYSENEDEALKKLFWGRVALMPLNELVGWEKIKKLYPDQSSIFSASNSAIDEQDLNVMVSRKYPDSEALLQRFNEGLNTIINNGVYKKIMEKHSIPPAIGVIEF